MSLSWLERLRLVVHPQRVVLERRRWRGGSTLQHSDVTPATAGEADWQPALAAATALLRSDARRGATLRIIVADHFVRYALLPWDDALSGRKARLSMARALYTDVLGESAAALEVAIDTPVFGHGGIAAGIDRQLVAGLRTAAREQGLRLASLQPRLICELAGWRGASSDGWFAAIDRGWLCLAGLRDGRPVRLHNCRSGSQTTAALAAELAGRLAADAAAVPTQPLFLCCRESDAPTMAAGYAPTLLRSALPEVGNA